MRLAKPLLDPPRLLDSELSDGTMGKAATTRIGAIDQRYSPKAIVLNTRANTETGMVGAIFVDIARSERLRFRAVDHRHVLLDKL